MVPTVSGIGNRKGVAPVELGWGKKNGPYCLVYPRPGYRALEFMIDVCPGKLSRKVGGRTMCAKTHPFLAKGRTSLFDPGKVNRRDKDELR